MKDFGIKEILISDKIITENDEIIQDKSFREILFVLFLYYFSYSKYQWYFKRIIEEQFYNVLNRKKDKVTTYMPRPSPFKFLGLGENILFIGDMPDSYYLFKEAFYENLFLREPLIDMVLGNLSDPSKKWEKNHICENLSGRYCKICKEEIAKFIEKEDMNSLIKTLNLKGYLKINIPPSIIKQIISFDEFVELIEEQNKCPCGALLYKGWKVCPYCAKEIDQKMFLKKQSHGNPEKMFNECLSLYLGCKKGYKIKKANHELDEVFNEEMDVFLQSPEMDKIRIIEGTNSFIIDKNYIKDKLKTLSVVQNQLEVVSQRERKKCPSIRMCLWMINQQENQKELEKIQETLFFEDKKFFMHTSDGKLENNLNIEISQKDLDFIKNSFYCIINKLIEFI